MLVTLTKYFERIHASKQAIRELDGIIRDRPDATTTAGKEKRRTTTVTTTTTTTTTSTTTTTTLLRMTQKKCISLITDPILTNL